MANSKSLDKLDTLQAKLQSLIYLFNLSYQALRWLQSHFRGHKFCYNFWDSLNQICNCGNSIESTKHYLLHCSNFKNEKQTLLQNVTTTKHDLLSMNKDVLTLLLLLYGNNTLTDSTNTFSSNSVVCYKIYSITIMF